MQQTALEAPDGPIDQPDSVIDRLADVTPIVVGAFGHAKGERVREITQAFVRHMHAFVREIGLKEEEYDYGVDFLNRIGKATNDHHNEGILFADSIGVSTLTCLLNNGDAGATETSAALLGPFWRAKSPLMTSGDSIVRSPTPGPELFAKIRLVDAGGKPIAGVEVDIWQSSPVGFYENQDPTQVDMNLRGKFVTDADGSFTFRSVRPGFYPVPVDGPVGDMIKAQGRHPYRPAHLHFLCFKEGFKTLITQVFVSDDPYLRSDVVFGVTTSLIGNYERHDDTTGAPAAGVAAPWYGLDQTLIMEHGEAKLPVPPIK